MAYRNLNDVDKQYRSIRYSLRVSCQLTMDIVSQQLKDIELKMVEDAEKRRITAGLSEPKILPNNNHKLI